MGAKTSFDLDGKPQIAESPLSVGQLLSLAGVPTEGFCIKAGDGAVYCDPSQLVEIRDGDKLASTRKPAPDRVEVHYKVNGEEQVTKTNPVSQEAILREAGAAASIDINDLGSYYLENIADGAKYENLADLITIKDGEQFLAVHVGATPVA